MMQPGEYIERTVQLLRARYQDYAVLVLNPRSQYRSHILGRLIKDPPCPLYYYGFSVDNSTMSDFLRLFVHAMKEQQPAFGYYSSRLIHQDEEFDLDSIIPALALDLGELGETDYILVLDEYDRAATWPNLHTLFSRLVAELPSNCHLLISSRTMPPFPWTTLVARNQAVVLDGDRLSSGITGMGSVST